MAVNNVFIKDGVRWKRCSKCGVEKSESEYYPDSSRGNRLRTKCKLCADKVFQFYKEKNRERFNESSRKRDSVRRANWTDAQKETRVLTFRRWYHETIEDRRMYTNNSRKTLRAEILTHYGKVCACCGEDKYEFLAIDHINGGGSKDREKHGSGPQMCAWLKKNNWPEGYRVLCHNCNMALGFYGYCPHPNSPLTAPSVPTRKTKRVVEGQNKLPLLESLLADAK